MLKVGDKVRVKTELMIEYPYGKWCFIGSMKKYMGEEATITRVSSSYYSLNIDDGCWKWTEEMLEEIESIPKLSPNEFYRNVIPESDIEGPAETKLEAKEPPKVSLTTGDEKVDDLLKYIGKSVRVRCNLIECKADRVHEYAMNQWIPIAQFGIIVYGILSSVQKYSLSKKLYGNTYATCRDTGDWIYIEFQEAYVENPNLYAEDILRDYSTHWPNSFIHVDGKELKRIRIPFNDTTSSIEFIPEEESPIARREVGNSPIPSKYDGDYGSCPSWNSP